MATTADLATAEALAEQAARSFREQGFTQVRGLLTADEVARFRTAALDAVRRQDIRKGKDEENIRIVTTHDIWRKDNTLRGLALHPRIGAIAERLAGMPVRVWSGEVFLKDPQNNGPTGLHDDLSFELLDSRVTFNTWIALVDVPVERGCMTFLPGSHRRPGPARADLSTQVSDPESYLFRHWPQLRWSPRVTVPLRAGDATFHHSRTAHMAGANTTQEDRLSFFITYTDAEATYRPLPGHNPLDLEPGQPLPDEHYPRIGK